MARDKTNSTTKKEREQKAQLDQEEVRLKAIADSADTSPSLRVSANRELRFIAKRRLELEEQITNRRKMAMRKQNSSKSAEPVNLAANPQSMTDVELVRATRANWWKAVFSDEGSPERARKAILWAEMESRFGKDNWIKRYEQICREQRI